MISVPHILQLPPKLMPVIERFNEFELFLLEGGRGSSKSHSAARIILFMSEARKIRTVCGREFATNIEESVHTLFSDLIEEYKLSFDVTVNRIRHHWSGSEIKFKGFREQGRVSVKGLEGTDILWVDEAQTLTKPTLDVIMPTMRKNNIKVFFTMNRHLREDAVPGYCIGRPECLHIKINYHENPFCPAILIRQAEDMKERSQRDYDHIWGGMPLSQADEHLFNFDKLHEAFEVTAFGDPVKPQKVLAIDFAAQGNDLCVATLLERVTSQHWLIKERIPWDQPDTTISTGKIVNLIGQFKPDITMFDIGGMGKPVYDRLQEVLAATGVQIIAFDGGSTDGVDISAHANKRAAGYYLVREWFDQKFLTLKEKDMEVVKELEHIKMKYRSNGVRLIQAKEDMKKDLGYSPDNADSLMMAIWGAAHHLGKSNLGTGSSGNIKRKSGSRQRRH